jgi:hypothetical protein
MPRRDLDILDLGTAITAVPQFLLPMDRLLIHRQTLF